MSMEGVHIQEKGTNNSFVCVGAGDHGVGTKWVLINGFGVVFSLSIEETNQVVHAKHEKYDMTKPPISMPKMLEPSAKKEGALATTMGAGGSKKDRAIAFYRENPGLDRSMYIEAFKTDLGMTDAGAGTYYAMCKKGS